MNDNLNPIYEEAAGKWQAKKGKGKVGTIVLFLALPVLLLIVFTYIPFVDMFKNSLTDWDGIYEAETAGGK